MRVSVLGSEDIPGDSRNPRWMCPILSRVMDDKSTFCAVECDDYCMWFDTEAFECAVFSNLDSIAHALNRGGRNG